MARLLPSNRTQREEATDADTTVRELDPETALLGIGALAVGYLVGRRLVGTETPSTDGLRERVGEALPGGGVDVPFGRTDEDGSTVEGDDGTAASTDPSLEEIDERTGSDVRTEPADPGEMHVDEELVEETVGDGMASDEDEETAADEDEETAADEDEETATDEDEEVA